MSTIRYNTNSNLIQRIQRNEYLNKQNKRVDANNRKLGFTTTNFSTNTQHDVNSKVNNNESGLYTQENFTTSSNSKLQGEITNDDEDPPFQSKYTKNSNEYLLDLCNSIYPSTLHDKLEGVSKLDNGSLEFHAFLALIVKNFINHWYGPKIPSEDPELLEEIFHIFNNFTLFIQDNTGNINMAGLLLDDIPVLIADHIKVLRTLKSHNIDRFTYEDYQQLSLIKQETYPFVITELIKYHLPCHSILQNTFLDSLLNQFLLGRIMDSCSEPYYILRAITKVSDKIIQRKEDQFSIKNMHCNVLQRLGSKIVSFFHSITKYNSSSRTLTSDNPVSENNNVLGSYIWTLINIDILSLHKKKPLFYTITCYFQNILISSNTLNGWINALFLEYVWTKALSTLNIKHILNLVRTLLFPNDDLMGPRTVVPTGEEFEIFKTQSAEKLWKVIQLKKLDKLLAVTEEDTISLIDMISTHDKRCNKMLILRILDCVAAHLTQEESLETLSTQ